MDRAGAEDGARDADARRLLGDGHGRNGRANTILGIGQGQTVTALELLHRLESTPDGRWSDKAMDRLSGIATAGDVDPTLARQFV